MNNQTNTTPENNESVFGEDDLNSEDLLKDGTDYTDVVEKYKNKKRNTVIAIVSIAIIVAVGIFLGSKYILENPEVEKTEPTHQASEPAEQTVPSQSPDYTEPKNPVSNLLPDLPEANNDKITALGEKDTLQTSHGTLMVVPQATITQTVNECEVRQSTDFCNVANIELNELSYNAYYLKNAAESRFFEEPNSFQETEVNGATAAAILEINKLDGTLTPILVILQQDGTGFMFVPSDKQIESLETLAETISVK